MGSDKIFLMRAIEIASKSIDSGGGPFGAVIVKSGKLLSEGNNRVVQTTDPTAHAEVLAIREAASALGTHDLDGCILYTSCEPCPMCLGAIYWAGIKKVIYACDRNDAEEAGFSDKLIYEEIALDPGERKVSFIRMKETGGKEVFRKWNGMADKIPY